MLVHLLLFTLCASKLYYLSDLRYPVPYCTIDNHANKSYRINNIMGSVEIYTDPLLINLIIKIYLNNVSSCQLCLHDTVYCTNESYHVDLSFTQDVNYNFRITVKRDGDNVFSTHIGNLTTKYKIEDKDYSELQIPLSTLLRFNNDTGSVDCNDKFDIILQIMARTEEWGQAFVLTPVDLLKTFDYIYYLDNTYNLLCIPTEEYLSTYDCSQSNIYRVNKYYPDNCLIPKNESLYSNYGNDYIKDLIGLLDLPSGCSIRNHIYYDSLLYHNMNIGDFNLNVIWCNETMISVLKKSIYDQNYLFQCKDVFKSLGYQSTTIDNFIYLKPFYRLYKEIMIALFNYMKCLSLNNTRVIELINFEKLLHISIGVLKSSCPFKNGFNGDYEQYNNLISRLIIFNTNGINHCTPCITSNISLQDQLHYCQYLYSNYNDSNEYLSHWYEEQKENDPIVNQNTTDYDKFFMLFLEGSQYYNNSIILSCVILLLFIFVMFIIIYLCTTKIILYLKKKRSYTTI